jgi:hypothetical protein
MTPPRIELGVSKLKVLRFGQLIYGAGENYYPLFKLCADLKNQKSNKHSDYASHYCTFVVLVKQKANNVDENQDCERHH